VIDPLLHRFDVAEEHRAGAALAHGCAGAVDIQPLIGVFPCRGRSGADALVKISAPPPVMALRPAPAGFEVSRMELNKAVRSGDLDGGEGIQLEAGSSASERGQKLDYHSFGSVDGAATM